MRGVFAGELQEMRLQIELMALRVSAALDQALEVTRSGDPEVAAAMMAADDEIDHMHVSLLERCYELLVREGPVASDFRLVISFIRVLDSLERSGDLCLRIAKTVPDHGLLAANPELHRATVEIGRVVKDRFDQVQAAWAATDPRDTDAWNYAPAPADTEELIGSVLREVMDLTGPEAARAAITTFIICRSFDRIADHTEVLLARLKYLVTGDAVFLADEVS